LCLAAILSSPSLRGVPPALGIGKEEDTGYAQCPGPGEPYTCGGTVIFELKREKAGEG